MAGIVILAGHYIDFFNMPGTVEVTDGLLVSRNCFSSFFLGLFIYVVFTALKVLCYQKKSYIEESKHFHY
jgi:hypothetical protein